MAENEEFRIDNDKLADWAIQKIKESEEERDRLISLAEDQIKDLTEKIQSFKDHCDNDTRYLKSCLSDYFNKVPHKSTKTQETYKLLSGTLVFKKPSLKIVPDEEKLISKLEGTEFIKIKKSLNWLEYKKCLEISGNDVIDTSTGEIVEGCAIEESPATFNIKY